MYRVRGKLVSPHSPSLDWCAKHGSKLLKVTWVAARTRATYLGAEDDIEHP